MSTAEALDVQIGSEANSQGDQYLTFLLAGEEYGVDILRVVEIKGWQTATQIPNTPEYVQGVINIRGTIVPIIDLRKRFGMPDLEYSQTTVVIVLYVNTQERTRTMGIVVDGVSDVCNVADEDLKSAPDFGGSISVEYVKGLSTVNENMVILLDIDHLLNSHELAQIAASDS
ncbi:MAG: chemotaxis protein CheW [Gammaproteobacteria bacterium]